MNIVVTSATEDLPPRRAFTAADISRMIDAGIIGEDERIELLDGDIVVMAAKKYAHETIKSALIEAIARTLPEEMGIGVEMTVKFADGTLLEPDIVVFERKALSRSEESYCRFNPGGILLAVEVADSTLGYDRRSKAPRYARFGVRECWVVDANARVTWIYTGPSDNGWSSMIKRESDENLTTSTLPDFSIRIGNIE